MKIEDSIECIPPTRLAIKSVELLDIVQLINDAFVEELNIPAPPAFVV